MLAPVVTANHVVVSEVYYDVDGLHGDEPAHEWIELHNPTATPVSLEGWSIIDTSGSIDVIPTGVVLAANGYVILAATTTLPTYWTVPADVPLVNLGSALGNGLGNLGDSLILRDSATTTVDALSWGTDTSIFDPGVVDVVSGHSIARDHAGVDTDLAGDWIDREDPTFGF
jgi:5'-nucleotidase